MVVDGLLAGAVFPFTILRRDLSLGPVLLDIQLHLADSVAPYVLLRHFCVGREVRIQQADGQTMAYGHAQGSSVDGGIGHSAAECVLENHPGDGDKVLLLLVVVRHRRPTLRHHHLPGLYSAVIQQTVASGAWRA